MVCLLAVIEDAHAFLLVALLVDELAVGVGGGGVVEQLWACVDLLADFVEGGHVVEGGGVGGSREVVSQFFDIDFP